MTHLILTSIGVLLVDVLAIEVYLLLATRVREPSRTRTIVFLWFAFAVLFGGMLALTKVPLSVFSGEVGELERLIALTPIVLASLYILIFRRKRFDEINKSFQAKRS